MRRCSVTLVALTLVLASGSVPAVEEFADGDGSAADPYVIEDWYHLDNVRLHLDADFVLGTDLDEETDGYDELVGDPEFGWEPISECGFDPWYDGCEGDGFSGTFDGQGYEIRGLVIDRDDAFAGVGLFNGTQGATIENVGLVDVDITGGFLNVGALAGTSVESTITDSYVTGDVTGEDSVGGLAGNNWGIVENSYATGNVTATGPGRLGDDPRAGSLLGTNGESDGVIGSYWDDEAATVIEEGDEQHGQGIGGLGTGAANVTALTTIEMTGANAEGNMDFDFADTWGVVDEPEDGNVVSYPFLQNVVQEPAPGLQSRYAGGDGSADDPYVIEDWHHLDNVRGNLDANFRLANELNEGTAGYNDVAGEDANHGDGFAPIDGFAGTFDGADNAIEELVIDRDDEERVGLFASTVPGAEIRDLHLDSADVTGQGDGVENGVGSLVGFNEGDISGASASGTVTGVSDVGGLVGHNLDAEIRESYTTARVGGDSNVGGLVGENIDGIIESYAIGTVTGDSDVGGLVGENDGDVIHSYWDVDATDQVKSDGSPDENGLTTAEMTGLNATVYMDGFDFPNSEGTWHVVEDDYPALAWEDTEAFFSVSITETNSPVGEGEILEVTATVTNWGADAEQSVTLTGTDLDPDAVQLDSGGTEEVTLEWTTEVGDADTGDVTVTTENEADRVTITIDAAPTPIPTASAWGLTVLSLLLVLIGYLRFSAP